MPSNLRPNLIGRAALMRVARTISSRARVVESHECTCSTASSARTPWRALLNTTREGSPTCRPWRARETSHLSPLMTWRQRSSMASATASLSRREGQRGPTGRAPSATNRTALRHKPARLRHLLQHRSGAPCGRTATRYMPPLPTMRACGGFCSTSTISTPRQRSLWSTWGPQTLPPTSLSMPSPACRRPIPTPHRSAQTTARRQLYLPPCFRHRTARATRATRARTEGRAWRAWRARTRLRLGPVLARHAQQASMRRGGTGARCSGV